MTDHGGDIYRNSVKLDFSVSLNPLGMPKEVEEALKEGVPLWSSYPDPCCTALRDELSSKLDVRKNSITFGNGAAELIYDLVFALRPGKALVCAPAFSEYEGALRAADCGISVFPLSEETDFQINAYRLAAAVTSDTDLVFLCNPGNPTGQCLCAEDVRKIEKACLERQAFLCVDESFAELTERPEYLSVISDCGKDPQLCVIRAFTKTYAMAGLRLGYLVCSDETLTSRISALRQPWSVSAPAQCAGLAALREVPDGYLCSARKLIASERRRMTAEFEKRGFHVIPGNANFILAFSPCPDLCERCLQRGFLIRDCRSFAGLRPGYIRIGLRTPEEDDMLLELLDELL